jgi:hypothetical protein
VHGYESMSEVSKDLGEVVDVLWLSGTRMYLYISNVFRDCNADK